MDADLPVFSGTSLAYAKASSTGDIWAPLVDSTLTRKGWYPNFRRTSTVVEYRGCLK